MYAFRPHWKIRFLLSQKVLSQGRKITVAAGLTSQGLTDLLIIPEDQNITSEVYQNFILPYYLSKPKRLYPDRWNSLKVQEDWATAHNSKSSKKSVVENWVGGVVCEKGNGEFFGHGNSPDLNPIENIRKELKDSILPQERPSNKEKFKELVLPQWEVLRASDIPKKLVQSFPNLVSAILTNNRQNKKYWN